MQSQLSMRAAKEALRHTVTHARAALPQAYRESASLRMLTMLRQQPAFREAGCVFLYASMPEEVQLYTLMEQCLQLGKTVCLPLITGPGTMEPVKLSAMSALVPGKFGIQTVDPAQRELLPPTAIDLIIVPGAAFDAQGRRLGLGAGYYDRFMAEQAPQAERIALAFDCQIVPEVPVEPHDQTVRLVLTESRCLEVSD